jgi:hypothetical protein
LGLGLGVGQRGGGGRGFPRGSRSSFLRLVCKPVSGLAFFCSATGSLLLGNPLGGLSGGFIGSASRRFQRRLSCGLLGGTFCDAKGRVPRSILGGCFGCFGGLRLRHGLRGGGLPQSFFACRFLPGRILTLGFFARCAGGILGGKLALGFSPRRLLCGFLCSLLCSFSGSVLRGAFCPFGPFGAFDLGPVGRLGRFEARRLDRSLPLHTLLRLAAGTPPQDPGDCCQGQQHQDAPGQAHAG